MAPLAQKRKYNFGRNFKLATIATQASDTNVRTLDILWE